MRPCKCKVWELKKDKTKGYELVPKKGLFHCWGLEEEDGVSSSVAIVELPDGNVVTVMPENIQFTDNSGQGA